MPILRDTTLANAARVPTSIVDRDVTYAPEGRCVDCDCCLSKYRKRDETRCAPCYSKRAMRLSTQKPPSDRYEQARRLLDQGATFTIIAEEYGWRNSASACAAIRHYEDRRGLKRAGVPRRRAA